MDWYSFIYQKTFWAGMGLIGLGAFKLSQGDIESGTSSIAQGFGLIFLRQAISKSDDKVVAQAAQIDEIKKGLP